MLKNFNRQWTQKRVRWKFHSSTLFLHAYNLLLRTYVLNSSSLYNIYHKPFQKRLERKPLAGQSNLRSSSSISRVPSPESRLGRTVPFSLRSRGRVFGQAFFEKGCGQAFFEKGCGQAFIQKGCGQAFFQKGYTQES
jgi:hypothetical protein